jgi:hypothetical protein
MAALVTHGGVPMSEPMAFGLGAGLGFAVIPLIKISGMPLVAYRTPPGAIIRGLSRRAGIRMCRATFRDPRRGMAALDRALDQGRIVGLQTSVFWLPYFPEAMRFHFNAHNLIVYGREAGEYLVSDPVFEEPVRCKREALEKARFAKGALAARGRMYYAERLPDGLDRARAIPAAIRANRRLMASTPLPFIGVRGIRRLGKMVAAVARGRRGEEDLPRFLGHIVRMQEEIGTGGAGFRFLYAAFLREAAEALASEPLDAASRVMTDAGDTWRQFALRAAKMCKGREPMDAALLASIIDRCADREAAAWDLLRSA